MPPFFVSACNQSLRWGLSLRSTGELQMLILDDWLEDRLDERRFNLAPATDAGEFAMLAGVLRAQAITDGYQVEALEGLCGGDIASYLMTRRLFVTAHGGT
jgi:hypothetical protein